MQRGLLFFSVLHRSDEGAYIFVRLYNVMLDYYSWSGHGQTIQLVPFNLALSTFVLCVFSFPEF